MVLVVEIIFSSPYFLVSFPKEIVSPPATKEDSCELSRSAVTMYLLGA
jgi:hypothetical protein